MNTQLGLELINLITPSYQMKILTAHSLYMMMSMTSFLLPDDMPEPLGKTGVTTTTMDANLNHCLANGKSLSGCLHFVNKPMLTGTQRNRLQ